VLKHPNWGACALETTANFLALPALCVPGRSTTCLSSLSCSCAMWGPSGVDNTQIWHCFHSKIYSEVPPLTFYFITKHTNRGLKNNVWDMISAKIHISELCHWKLHFMNFSYAIMIFNIMIFEFHSAWNSHYWIFIRRETVIIEMVIRHGTLKNQNSSSGLAGKSHGKL
jgi:hypothetical protein